MASKSVVDEDVAVLPDVRCGIEVTSHHDRLDHALDGLEAISTVIQNNIDGEQPGFWSDTFIGMLTMGHDALVAFARQEAGAMREELWRMHALSGEYGDEVKRRALQENTEAVS